MFTIKLRQFIYISDKILVRNVRNRVRRINDPGISNRLKAFKDEGIALQDEDAEEYIEQSESDFYDTGSAYNEHINETLIGKHELRHHIIKEKYFKENMPNLLTWSEKEQIRHLATTEPNEWTPQRIAESFPVTEQTVKVYFSYYMFMAFGLAALKLLKFPWKPATVQRIERHDASAMRNWRELKEGTLQISEDLRQHFLKFSNRNIPPLNKKSIKIDLTPDNVKIGEFEQIIRKCAEKEHTPPPEDTSSEKNDIVNKVNVKKTKDFKQTLTLKELTTKIKQRLEGGNNIDVSDKMIIDTVNAKDENNISKINTELDLVKETKQDNQLADFKKPDDLEYKITYAERIRIPKRAFRKGATYKVNDCFYDDDGRFLYRVIGLTKSVS